MLEQDFKTENKCENYPSLTDTLINSFLRYPSQSKLLSVFTCVGDLLLWLDKSLLYSALFEKNKNTG